MNLMGNQPGSVFTVGVVCWDSLIISKFPSRLIKSVFARMTPGRGVLILLLVSSVQELQEYAFVRLFKIMEQRDDKEYMAKLLVGWERQLAEPRASALLEKPGRDFLLTSPDHAKQSLAKFRKSSTISSNYNATT